MGKITRDFTSYTQRQTKETEALAIGYFEINKILVCTVSIYYLIVITSDADVDISVASGHDVYFYIYISLLNRSWASTKKDDLLHSKYYKYLNDNHANYGHLN